MKTQNNKSLAQLTVKFLSDADLKKVLGVTSRADMFLMADHEGYVWNAVHKGWSLGKVENSEIAMDISKAKPETIPAETPAKPKVEKKPITKETKKTTTTLPLAPTTDNVIMDENIAALVELGHLVVKATGAVVKDVEVITEKSGKQCYKMTADNGKVHNWYPNLVFRYAEIKK